MDFELSEEQSLLKSTLAHYLAQQYDFAKRTAASRSEPGCRADIWQGLASDLGLLGVAVPLDAGGLGGGAVEQMIVMEEAGRALLLEPLAETLFQGGWLLQKCGAAGLLPLIMSGSVRLAVAIGEPDMRFDYEDIAAAATRHGDGWRLCGHKAVVMAAPWATHFLIAARTSGARGDAHGISLFLTTPEANGLTLHRYQTLDERRAADMELKDVSVEAGALIGEEGEALALLEEMRDRAIAAQAAEATGLLDRLVRDTVDYARQRKQFGQPIAAFQALQHRIVDMHMHVELARSAAVLASLKLDAPATERALASSAAKVTIAKACRFVGQNSVQLHGGMGMTDDLPIGHYFKRATVIETEFGGEGWHLARHVRLSRQLPV
jgi:butyryl-CoA dehydrogenase